MKQVFRREQIEAFARAWQGAEKSGSISPDALQSLQARFIATDAAGASWTMRLRTLEWYRAEQGRWAPGTPPAELYFDDAVIAQGRKLVPSVAEVADHAHASPIQASQPATESNEKGVPATSKPMFGPGFSPQRAAAALFAVAVVGTWSGPLGPHLLLATLALVAAWGLWKGRRWAFPVALSAASVWLLFSVRDLPMFPPSSVFWSGWSHWLSFWLSHWLSWWFPKWGLSIGLFISAVILLFSRAGREERRRNSSPQ